jgi:hypothetical protein
MLPEIPFLIFLSELTLHAARFVILHCFCTTCASLLERFFFNILWLTSCAICNLFHELCVFLKH